MRRRSHSHGLDRLRDRIHSEGVIGGDRHTMCLCRYRPSLTRSLTHVVRTQHRKQLRGHSHRPEAMVSRRTALVSIGICTGNELLRIAHAEEMSVAERTPPTDGENGTKVLRSTAGFEFVYPSSWLVAFERGESMKEGTIAFVGNFLTIDTFSVEKFQMAKGTEGVDLKLLAEDDVEPVRQSPGSMEFEVLSGAYRDTAQGPSSVYVLEYCVETCKGLVTEALGGKKSCKDAKDNELTTIRRHHLLGITSTPNNVFYLRASCPTPRWEDAKNDLWMVLNSFVAYKARSDTSE